MSQADSIAKAPRTNPDGDHALSWLTIDLQALAHNYNLIREKVGSQCHVAAAVKADAYGLGMAQATLVLAQHGCRTFFVATIEEAFSLRASFAGTPHQQVEIMTLSGLLSGVEDEYVQNNIIPVLNSLDEAGRWNETAKKHGKMLPAVIHFDTGMNRLGLPACEADIIFEQPEKRDAIDVSMIMSHFSCADEHDNPVTHEQYERFTTIADHFPNARKSLANSSGIFRSDDYHFDLVRPGMALYGLNPVPETSNPMKPVVALETKILQVQTVPKGAYAGYGRTYRFGKDAMLATVGLGYADGFFRALGNKAKLYYKGKPCPVVGRVSMDLVTVDMGSHTPQPGEKLEVIGPHQSADDLAETAGTIGYEILTSLGNRHHRQYLS